jgi:hypothetical protein
MHKSDVKLLKGVAAVFAFMAAFAVVFALLINVAVDASGGQTKYSSRGAETTNCTVDVSHCKDTRCVIDISGC